MTNPGGFKPAGPLNAYRPPVKARNTSLSKCKNQSFINFIRRHLSFTGLNVSGRSTGPWETWVLWLKIILCCTIWFRWDQLLDLLQNHQHWSEAVWYRQFSVPKYIIILIFFLKQWFFFRKIIKNVIRIKVFLFIDSDLLVLVIISILHRPCMLVRI